MSPVLFFGPVSDRFGGRRLLAIPADGLTVAELRRRLAADDPEGPDALHHPGVRISVDQALAPETLVIRPGQEVAVLSPFSGG